MLYSTAYTTHVAQELKNFKFVLKPRGWSNPLATPFSMEDDVLQPRSGAEGGIGRSRMEFVKDGI